MRRYTAFILFMASPVAALQPCAPLHNTLGILSGSPTGAYNVAAAFHDEGARYNVDPRFLVAATKSQSNGCDTGIPEALTCCGLNDPFSLGFCQVSRTMEEGVRRETRRISSNYISQGQANLHSIATGELFVNPGEISELFEAMFGLPGQAIYYSWSCCGDCNNDQDVAINELIYVVCVALDSYMQDCPISACWRGDSDVDGRVLVHDIIRDLVTSYNPCPAP